MTTLPQYPQSQFTVGQKVFDVHFEIGINPPPMRGYYALTVLGNGGVKFEAMGQTPAEALAKVAMDMEGSGMWQMIAGNTGANPFPFVSSKPPAAVPVPTNTPNKKDPDIIKEQPSYLAGKPKGQCEALCLSYENFGATKCNTSVCAGKK